jgi:DNA repair photolyase
MRGNLLHVLRDLGDGGSVESRREPSRGTGSIMGEPGRRRYCTLVPVRTGAYTFAMAKVDYREEPCTSALNRVHGMPGLEWSLNPYMGCAHRCTFCYVRAFEKRADRPSDQRYGTSIRVKINIADVLRLELRRRSWKRASVVVGAATDPYQPAEGHYRLTRKCLETLSDARNPFGIITRGPMVVRDIDVLQEASSRAKVGVHLSIPTLDHDVWRHTEPGSPPPRQRMRAVRMLADAGIDVGIGMAPILPGVSDRPEQLAEVVRAAREAGATRVWANVLYMKPGTREHFLAELRKSFPDAVAPIERLYAGRAYLDDGTTRPVRDEVRALARRYDIRDRRTVRLRPPEEPVQLDLAV